MNGGRRNGAGDWGPRASFGILERARKTRFPLPKLGAFWQVRRLEVVCLQGSAATWGAKIRGVCAFGAGATYRSKIVGQAEIATEFTEVTEEEGRPLAVSSEGVRLSSSKILVFLRRCQVTAEGVKLFAPSRVRSAMAVWSTTSARSMNGSGVARQELPATGVVDLARARTTTPFAALRDVPPGIPGRLHRIAEIGFVRDRGGIWASTRVSREHGA